jgi:hypothetical protein
MEVARLCIEVREEEQGSVPLLVLSLVNISFRRRSRMCACRSAPNALRMEPPAPASRASTSRESMLKQPPILSAPSGAVSSMPLLGGCRSLAYGRSPAGVSFVPHPLNKQKG